MIMYLLSVLIVFIALMIVGWDARHNPTKSVRFKLMFNFISAMIWPIFLVTLLIDIAEFIYMKILKCLKH